MRSPDSALSYKTNVCAGNRHGAQTLHEHPWLSRHAAGDGPLRGILNCDSNGQSWPVGLIPCRQSSALAFTPGPLIAAAAYGLAAIAINWVHSVGESAE